MKLLISALKHAGIVFLFFILSAIYFYPTFQGYELNQGDINHFKGMSKELRDYRLANDDQALWTNSMFGGMPAYQISMKPTNNLAANIISGVRAALPGPVGIMWLAMTCFYILCCCLKLDILIGMMASIAYGFASFNVLYLGAGHASKIVTVALMPGLVGGVLLCFRGKLLYGLAISVLFGALQLAANHPQMTYYLLILLGLIVIEEIIRLSLKKEGKKAGLAVATLAVAGILSFLPNSVGLLTTYEYSKHTTRGESELTTLIDQGATQ
ncbi:MAG: DUF6541 family protein, partial [Bacteroidota bacterium]